MAIGSSDLPVPWEDLAELLSKDLDHSQQRGLKVRSVSRGAGVASQLVVIVQADSGATGQPQTWRLTYDIPLDDLNLLAPESFVLTVRANIEEWWDTRPTQPVHLVAERLD
jgi:hypothetical protein